MEDESEKELRWDYRYPKKREFLGAPISIWVTMLVSGFLFYQILCHKSEIKSVIRPAVISATTGIPYSIIREAERKGFFDKYQKMSVEERHSALQEMNIEEKLKDAGWNDFEIHELGSRLSICKPPEQNQEY